MINVLERKKSSKSSGECLRWGGRSLSEKVTFEQGLKISVMMKDTEKIKVTNIYAPNNRTAKAPRIRKRKQYNYT